MGPRQRRSAALTTEQEERVVGLRKAAMLPLDDLLGRVRESLPQLSRGALHRCLRRHGVSRLPRPEGSSKRGRFEETEIGYVHADS
ncbi:hypothetical protein BH11ARM2_BH11ARM2_08220 [soil metagenome]